MISYTLYVYTNMYVLEVHSIHISDVPMAHYFFPFFFLFLVLFNPLPDSEIASPDRASKSSIPSYVASPASKTTVVASTSFTAAEISPDVSNM